MIEINPEQEVAAICTRIKQERMKRNITQLDLSLEAGLSQSYIAEIERANKSPSLSSFIRIANALNMEPSDFFKTNDNKLKTQLKREIIDFVSKL